MEETLKTFKLKINKKKTKILICARNPQNIVVDISRDDHKLEQVIKFLYLHTFGDKDAKEIKKHIGMVKSAFSKKFELFMSKKI